MTILVAIVAFAVPTDGPGADEILKSVGAAANRAADARMTLKIEVSTKDGDTLSRTLAVWQRGADKRMVKFTAPARLRGTGILADGGQTWLYTASYKRFRRVAGKAGGGAWMGTGFSINDLARVRFAGDYVPKVMSQDATTWTLALAPKDPEAHRHAGLELTVRKKDHLVAKIVTLKPGGGTLRTITADDFKATGKYTIAHRIKIDDASTGKTTTATVVAAQFDTGLSPDFFTERQLRRSP